MIKLVVGLGNPGHQYEKTRHNVGFIFLDELGFTYRAGWSAMSQFQGEVASCVIAGQQLILLKPQTFMNKSGGAVGKLLRYYKIKPEQMLVVHDELELAEGVCKLKRDGGHAGHNGLRDIIANIDSRDFYRLRIGIGRPQIGANIADYVLSKPSQDGLIQLENAVRFGLAHMDELLAAKLVEFNQLTQV